MYIEWSVIVGIYCLVYAAMPVLCKVYVHQCQIGDAVSHSCLES